MRKAALKNWFSRIFTRDINLSKNTLLYLFFSLLSITIVSETFLFEYTISTGGVLYVGLEVYALLIILAVSFLISGIIVDFIKNRTNYFNITLLICIIGLFISAIPVKIFYYLGLLIVLLTVPQLIILWFTIFVHETNILNRGRIAAYLLILCFSLAFISLLFIIFDFLYIFLGILELGIFVIIYKYSREYRYIETKQRLKSEKKYLKIIIEKHFFRYSISFFILSFILGDLLARYSFDVDLFIFAIASFLYIIAAGCFLDNLGRKTSIVLGILVVSFFLISYGSFIESDYIFGMPRKTLLSIHYGFSLLPLLLAIFTISGDFSTERGNLKYRGRINGFFMALLFLGAIIGFTFSRWISDMYNRFPAFNNFLPNFPNLLNGFILVILLVWMMAMKEFLVSKEKKWADSLKNIIIFNKSGICLYNYSFEKKDVFKGEADETEFDEDLIAGAFSGVITIISEITHTKRQIRQIQKEEATLIFTYGKFHIVALIASMDLPVLFKKIDEFSRDFEQKFAKELKNFQGKVSHFEPTKFLIIKYFSPKYDEFIK
ncbi:MAG: hypothetical protein E3J52_01015 [Promethearchaeota archaeon]|nr:MAG: hypothetical protein E3J52_01015 [Candidatus Lokiarchaeota archaeon]